MKCRTQISVRLKLSESIRLHTVYDCKYILGCSITTYNEPMLADLGLETLKYRRDYS